MIVVDSQFRHEVEMSTSFLLIIVTPPQFYRPHFFIERTNIYLESTIQSYKYCLVEDIM